MSRNSFTSEASGASADERILGTVASVVARELGIAGAPVAVVRLAGDASSRAYFRAEWEGGSAIVVRYPRSFGSAQTSGERLDLWCAERPDDGRVTFANDPICHVELTRLLPRYGVPVPEVLAVADAESMLVLADEGDVLLQAWLRDATLAERDLAYERAIDLIACFRAATEAVEGTGTAAARLAFDHAKLVWELEFFRVHTFERYLSEPLETDLYITVQEECRALASELSARPRCLCHRDYHARNIMLRPGAELPDALVVIDYQDARMGPLTYDLVSILEDPYVPLDAGFRARMRERFVERLHYDGVWPGAEAFQEEYDLMTVQRLLKAVGTYTSQAVLGRTVYVPYIEPALIEAKAALDRLGRFPALRQAIDRVGAGDCGLGAGQSLAAGTSASPHDVGTSPQPSAPGPQSSTTENLKAMNHVYIENLSRHVGEEVAIKGWLYNIRSSGKLMFPQIRDGSGIVQGVVFRKNVPEQVWEDFKRLTQESALVVTGTVRAEERAPGGYEIDVTGVEVVSIAESYPITPKEHGVDFLLDHRHLWIRSRLQHAVLRVRHEVVRAVRDYFDDRGFILADTPIFTPNACEGTTTLFAVDYFGQNAYLTQSGQLYNEATAMAFGRVYAFGPTFRAEKSKTRRHLTEFWMVEPEVAYATLDDVMDLAEDFLVSIVGRVLDRRREELKILERDLSKLEAIQKPFPRLSYDEASKMLAEAPAETGINFEYGSDFGSPDETYVSARYDRPVMVHRYPAAVKAFYMKPDPADPTKALGVDVLAPEGYGEIIGGGERSADLEFLRRQIAAHGLPEEAFDWYLDLRKYGSVPHGGFGMGIERCVTWICGIEHLRETIPFPRMLHRLDP